MREDEVDEDLLAKEREFVTEQAQASGKPDNVIDKIVEGRMKDFFKERVLLNQPFIKDEKRTIADLLEEFQRTSGEKIELIRFARYQVGA